MPHSDTRPDFLLAAESAGVAISQIAAAMDKSEFWVSRVLAGRTNCSTAEAAQIADLLNLDPARTNSLVKAPESPQSTLWDRLPAQILDKIVVGTLALIIGLYLQHGFNRASLRTERALAVSNTRSSFLEVRYDQVESDFVDLLVQVASARTARTSPTFNLNSEGAKAAAEQIESLRDRIEVYVDTISSIYSTTSTSGKALTTSLEDVAAPFIARTEVPNGLDQRIDTARRAFVEFSGSCQVALVGTVTDEFDRVTTGES